jgi:dTDP-4-amino-4,6-dideoxygalactose transaminase
MRSTLSPQLTVPIARPSFGPEEEAAALAAMRSGQFAQGERVRAFEEAFASVTGARFAVATSSGTTALLLALLAHEVGPGDEVITSPLTFIATGNAIVQAGATPVFADVDDTLNLDPASVASLIGPRTRALLPVHLHGSPCDMRALCGLAARHGLAVVQDACQAVGATLGGRPLGGFGTAVYSLYATKNITTGEGGMVTTDDPSVAAACARLRHQAYAGQAYLHDQVAYNFRLTEIQAAIGLVQLGRLEAIAARRRAFAAVYDSALGGRLVRPRVLEGAGHVLHQYTVRLPEDDGSGSTRDGLRASLAADGVATGVYYQVPLHRQPAYRWLEGADCPRADRAAADMLSLPIHHALTDDEVAWAAECVARAGAQR